MGEKAVVKAVLFYDCTEETCTSRIMKRASESEVKRSDDNLESLKKRFHTYQNSSMPIIKHFETLNLCKRIDASPEPNAVWEVTKNIIENL